MQTDFYIHDQGTIVILVPATEAADAWVSDHIPADATRYGPGIVIEPRYVADILEGAVADGLTVSA